MTERDPDPTIEDVPTSEEPADDDAPEVKNDPIPEENQ